AFVQDRARSGNIALQEDGIAEHVEHDADVMAVAGGAPDGETFLAASTSERVVALLAGQPPESTQDHGLRDPLSSRTRGNQRLVQQWLGDGVIAPRLGIPGEVDQRAEHKPRVTCLARGDYAVAQPLLD